MSGCLKHGSVVGVADASSRKVEDVAANEPVVKQLSSVLTADTRKYELIL